MKKSKRYFIFLIVIFALLVSATTTTITYANPNEFTFDFSPFKERIESSPDECWKKPAQNHKNSMVNKLTEIQELIDTGNFEDAYDKMLHDIKPKLTGLKTDENEEPWGNGIFNKPWVTCTDLREELRVECNLILAQINPLAVYDDDKTPPEMSIIYEGMQNVDDPGVWHVDVEDLESGLDIVIISVNGIEEIYDLNGEWFTSYDILVPAVIGINTIEVTATNNDKEFVGDQETSIESDWVEIISDLTPPIIDHPEDTHYVLGRTGNTITWIATDEHPSTYTVLLDDMLYKSGDWETEIPIIVNIDGLLFGSYEFKITVHDAYENLADDVVMVSVHEEDNTPPIILEQYDGGYTEDQPGHWKVYPWDEESGLGEVYITLSYEGEIYYEFQEYLDGIEYKLFKAPLKKWAIGIHTINVVAKNDINYDGVQETSLMEKSVEIEEYIPPEPLPGDDNSPPKFTIYYEGEYTEFNPGTWSILVIDHDSGLDEVLIEVDGIEYLHETGLGGIIQKIYWYIPVPSEPGIHIINVTATNDIAYDGVQETGWKAHSVTIILDETPPSIIVGYDGDCNIDNPGVWNVYVEDLESGLDSIKIYVDGELIYDEQLGGIAFKSYSDIAVPAVEGVHIIKVVAKDSNLNEIESIESVDVGTGSQPPTPPIIIG